ncbi:MAG TPA: tetratricopeptide repeat protein [Thermoanaerobaculia bacterium]|nr:tetratricopeptide repeat protein [Thermoanaerobaculia bacterium]
MSKKGAERGLIALLFGLALAWPSAAPAQNISSPQVTGVEMTPPVRQTLKQVEEEWVQWIGAFYRKDQPKADQVVTDLLSTAQQLGMTRLPDLSVAASAAAVQAAQQKDFPRARWALAAAERLDPERPESAFATARVDRLEGSYLDGVIHLFGGYSRLLRLPLERYLWLQNLAVWSLSLLLLTGGLFIVLQMMTKGRALVQDLAGFFGRKLPPAAAVAVTAVFLLWPLALPYGALWLPLFWSVLLWGYASTSERTVLIALWLLVGAAPLLVTEQRRRVAVELSPPVQAMESLDQHRLYGGLFMDLGVLRSVLPESPAVKHMVADLHRTLNQWELSRSLYRQVLESEPENTAALLNLGAFFFFKGDFGPAIDTFQKVAKVDPRSAAAQFNLSQAYSESYLFDEANAALEKAKAIDESNRVNVWIKRVDSQRVVTNNGGLARIPEIRRQLLESWQPEETSSARLDRFRKGLSVILSFGLILLAVALHLGRRNRGYAPLPNDLWAGGRTADRWRRAFLPGFSSARAGEGPRAFFALLFPTGLLLLPFLGRLGYRIPWGYDPGSYLAWIASILGLLLYFGARLRWELRNEI